LSTTSGSERSGGSDSLPLATGSLGGVALGTSVRVPAHEALGQTAPVPHWTAFCEEDEDSEADSEIAPVCAESFAVEESRASPPSVEKLATARYAEPPACEAPDHWQTTPIATDAPSHPQHSQDPWSAGLDPWSASIPTGPGAVVTAPGTQGTPPSFRPVRIQEPMQAPLVNLPAVSLPANPVVPAALVPATASVPASLTATPATVPGGCASPQSLRHSPSPFVPAVPAVGPGVATPSAQRVANGEALVASGQQGRAHRKFHVDFGRLQGQRTGIRVSPVARGLAVFEIGQGAISDWNDRCRTFPDDAVQVNDVICYVNGLKPQPELSPNHCKAMADELRDAMAVLLLVQRG